MNSFSKITFQHYQAFIISFYTFICLNWTSISLLKPNSFLLTCKTLLKVSLIGSFMNKLSTLKNIFPYNRRKILMIIKRAFVHVVVFILKILANGKKKDLNHTLMKLNVNVQPFKKTFLWKTFRHYKKLSLFWVLKITFLSIKFNPGQCVNSCKNTRSDVMMMKWMIWLAIFWETHLKNSIKK